jgi:hypothetical protein
MQNLIFFCQYIVLWGLQIPGSRNRAGVPKKPTYVPGIGRVCSVLLYRSALLFFRAEQSKRFEKLG